LVALLHDGSVLLTGGPDGASALYDPQSGAWSVTSSLAVARYGATATVLPDGDVLVAGGQSGDGGGALSSSEIYNPSKGTWAPTGSMPAGRYGQSAALMPNGAVIVAGGCSENCDNGPATDATYVYLGGFWSATASLTASRYGQSAVTLRDGDVLLAGGAQDDSADATTSAELYIPPLVSVSPSKAAAGDRITVAGGGFYAHEMVVLSLVGPSYRVLAKPETSPRGTFVVSLPVPSVPAGHYQVSAESQTSFAAASSPFTVDP
jgi:hypothetical protein